MVANVSATDDVSGCEAETTYEEAEEEISLEFEELLTSESREVAYSGYGESYFSGTKLTIYKALKEDFESVTENGGSTIFSVTVDEMEVGDCTYSS